MARAKANARLALQLAVGQLQLHAGPDTRITATSDILVPGATGSPNRMTGVWKSRKLNPESPAALYANKDTEFLGWLVSNEDSGAVRTTDQAFGQSAPIDNPVTLFSNNVLGTGATVITGGRVPVQDVLSGTNPSGHYAYNVQDEGVKARIDLGTPEAAGTDLAAQTQVLGVGQNPGLDRLKLDGSTYITQPTDPLTPGKLISLSEADIGFGTGRGEFAKKLNDLTPHSLGLLTNVVDGGLKKDLNLMAETATPPTEFAGKGIYESSSLEFNSIPGSDRSWNQALEFARMFNDPAKVIKDGSTPVVKAYAPSNWNASAGTGIATTAKPSGLVLMPSIAKVQMVFSIAARDIYRSTTPYPPLPPQVNAENATSLRPGLQGPWNNSMNGKVHSDDTSTPGVNESGSDFTPKKQPSPYVYLLHLIWSPIITLHNPYNVAMEFPSLKVEFQNIPFQLQVFRQTDGQPGFVKQSNSMQSFQRMMNAAQGNKTFGITLKNHLSNGTSIRLAPGEVKVFSIEVPGMDSFKFNPGSDWAKYFWDIHGNRTVAGGEVLNEFQLEKNITATPGWRGAEYGFDHDALQGLGGAVVSTKETYQGQTYERGRNVFMQPADKMKIQFAPIPDTAAPNSTKFAVQATLPGMNPDATARTSMIEFDYGSNEGLRNRLKQTWPEPASNTGYFETEEWEAQTDLRDKWDLLLSDYNNNKPFALFSAYAKTTYGGENDSAQDGSYAGKPWMFNNTTGPVSVQNITTEHPAVHSYEINFESLPGDTDNSVEVDANQRGNFITGHSKVHGVQFGSVYDIPLAPLQSLVSLNGANLGSSYYNPNFTMPIGNSYAHPMLNTSSIKTAAGGADHSFLLNSILFDGFYCSGIQSNTSDFGDGRTVNQIVTGFFDSTKPLVDRRLTPYFADGATQTEIEDKMKAQEAYKEAAAYMVLKGAFNVNSTSVDAWKAMLSSMAKTGGQLNDPTAGVSKLSDQTDDKGARFSRFRLPNSEDVDSKETYWQGGRELTRTQLDDLAQKIVDQVKLRGPFLSLGEFVNRKVGASAPETLAGALQTAIDDAGLNKDLAEDNDAGYEITGQKIAEYVNPSIANPEALEGSSAQGAPGFLTQADLLSVLGNAISARSDTFVIRAYGDAVDVQGKVLARAYCEAVVQRTPEYVNEADAATVAQPVNTDNQKFGRQFQIQSFRWLNPDEV